MEGFPEDVSVAIVTHNALNHIPATLESLKTAGCPNHQITVIDVASTDGCPEWVESHWEGVHILCLNLNDGPNPARNLGITNSTNPYVLLMDSDVMLKPDTVPLLREVMGQDSSVAIGSPIVVYAKQLDIIQYAGTFLHFMCEVVNPWQHRSVSELSSEPRDIGCASGCALLINRNAAIKVGLFDERYFMGKEDGDFTHRIKLAGYRIVEVPNAMVIHDVSPRSTKYFQYQIRNRWHFMLKNYQIKTLLLLLPILLVHELLQFTLLTYKGHAITYFKAVFSLIKMLPSLHSDRSCISSFRLCQDRDLLVGGAMVVREDMLNNSFLVGCKKIYDTILDSYWRLINWKV